MRSERDSEGGFVVAVLLASLIPLLLVVGAFSVAMTGKTNELRVELDRERALLVAESGIDDAIYRAQTSPTPTGFAVPYTGTVGVGTAFAVEWTHLLTDGDDNDNDGTPDEADEDVYQVIVTGSYRGTQRRLAAYLGPVPPLPAITTAVATLNPAPTIVMSGTPLISGRDRNLDGTLTGSEVPALSVETFGLSSPTETVLRDELDASEANGVLGAGAAPNPPSVGTTSMFGDLGEFDDLVTQITNIADLVLVGASYSSYDFGDATATPPDTHITYRNGNVRFQGNSRGAGILLVTGDLEMKGTFRFDGVMIVLGDVISAGTVDIYGAILQGPGGDLRQLNGTMEIHYSSEAIAEARNTRLIYAAFNGWQELSQ